MKTNELIARLQELDPTGEMDVCWADEYSLLPVYLTEIYKMERPVGTPTPSDIPYPILMIS